MKLPGKTKTWIIHPTQIDIRNKLVNQLSISPFLAQLLINRGIEDTKQARLFLEGTLDDLHSPWLFSDMEKAVNRIKQAIKQKELICIYGDYDVDGITGVALLSREFTRIGVAHEVYIPQRLTEGYGLSQNALAHIKQKGVKLIITVDCGISNHKEAAIAMQWGMDIIITDHHEPPASAPDAYAILNPKQADCGYPYSFLAGVGVAAKLAQALTDGKSADNGLTRNLDLVCLGTVADVLPLTGENRILVKYGLQQLTDTSKLGIKLLKEIAGVGEDAVNVGNIAFRLAPRLNAAGRIGDPYTAFRLLLSSSLNEVRKCVRKLETYNQQRKLIEEQILCDARRQWEEQAGKEEKSAIILDSPNWHIGVVGIVASKLVDEYYLPTVLICTDTDIAKGSARGIPNLDLYGVLTECAPHLLAYGGHKYAAGLTIEHSKIERFRDQFNKITRERLTKEDLLKQVTIDFELHLDDLQLDMMDEIECLAPFGRANPTPTFCSNGINILKYPREVGNNHLKMKVRQGRQVVDSIGFNMGLFKNSLNNAISSPVDIVFQPQINTWQGRQQLQLKLKDIRFS